MLNEFLQVRKKYLPYTDACIHSKLIKYNVLPKHQQLRKPGQISKLINLVKVIVKKRLIMIKTKQEVVHSYLYNNHRSRRPKP